MIIGNPSFHDSRHQLAACHPAQVQGKQVTIHHPIHITGQQANFGNQAIYTGANIHIHHHQSHRKDPLESEESYLSSKKVVKTCSGICALCHYKSSKILQNVMSGCDTGELQVTV